MFCSSCGNDVQAGLKYCNRCGNRLSSADDALDQLKPVVKTDKVVDHLATVFGVSWLLVRQIAGALNFNRQLQSWSADRNAPVATRDTQPQQLEATGAGISVTEQTTRYFEAVYTERNPQ
jgi:hypothetical protein